MNETENIIRAKHDFYVAEANERLRDLRRLDCLQKIETWTALATSAMDSAKGANITSYSIAGRSITKGETNGLLVRADALEREIKLMLGYSDGGVLVGDLSGAFTR